MARLTTLAKRIEAFFFDEQPIHALVVCRIGFGLCLFGAYVTRGSELALLFGPDGFSGAALHARAPEGWPQTLWPWQPFQWLHLTSSEALVRGLWVALLASSLAFAAGLRARVSGSIALLLHATFHAHNHILLVGWAYLIKPYMAYVILSRAGEHFSLDAWWHRRRGGRAPAALAPGWPLRLLQIHLCTMYAVAGWSRLVEPAWLRGDMLFVALNWQWHSRLHFDWWSLQHVLRPLAMGALVLEPLAPILLWLRRIGPWWALALIGMHVVLEITGNIGWWQFMMIAGLTAFLPAAWLERALRLGAPGAAAPRKPANLH